MDPILKKFLSSSMLHKEAVGVMTMCGQHKATMVC